MTKSKSSDLTGGPLVPDLGHRLLCYNHCSFQMPGRAVRMRASSCLASWSQVRPEEKVRELAFVT